MYKIVWNNCPWKRKQHGLFEMQKEEEAPKSSCDLDSGRNQFGGDRIWWGIQTVTLPWKSSTIDLPLFDHVTLPGIKASCLWKRKKGGPVRKGSLCS